MNQTLSCTSSSLPAYLLLLLRTVHYLCNIDKTLIPHPPFAYIVLSILSQTV